MPKVKHIHIDFTSWSSWKLCPQKMKYGLMDGYQNPKGNPATDFGAAVHKALEVYQTAGDKDAALSAAIEMARTTSLASIESGERRSEQHLVNTLKGYFQQYPFPDPMYDVIQLEKKIAAPVNDWLTYWGTVDGVVKARRGGHEAILERKTTTSFNEVFMTRMLVSAQVTGYFFLAKANGFKPVTAIVDAIQTSALYKIVNEPGLYFKRFEERRTDGQISEWLQVLIRDAERIKQDIETENYSTNMPEGCTAFNSVCAFANVCTVPRESRPVVLRSSYVVNQWPGIKIEYE